MIPARVWGASLLVAGTTLGAGFLGLPVVTGPLGFFPSTLVFFAYWMVMTYTAFLLLEATLWFDHDTNLISIARMTLGKGGQALTWCIYLFLLYALTTSYLAGLSPLFLDFFAWSSGIRPDPWISYLPLLFLFGLCLFQGTAWMDWLNRCMMLMILILFLVIASSLGPHIDSSRLRHVDWSYLPGALSMIAVSFGFHIIIPTLVNYLDRDVKLCKQAIWIGTALPFLIYILWEVVCLGSIPVEGRWSLREAFHGGMPSSELLAQKASSLSMLLSLRFFSFFLIATSFLGVSLSLFDFIADGLHIPKNHLGKGMLYSLTFLPPVFIALTWPRIFLTALDYAGAFGVVILLAILPCAFVYFGRRRFGTHAPYRVRGGYPVMCVIVCISCLVVVNELILKVFG